MYTREELREADRWWDYLSPDTKVRIYKWENDRDAREQACPNGIPK